MVMITQVLGVVFLLQSSIHQSYALQCYNCSNISDPDECLTVTECLVGQSCYMDQSTSGHATTMGCTENTQCGVPSGAGGTLVGRDLTKRETPACHECCSTDRCNKYLCAHLKLSACIDDIKMDCALLNTVINICHDIHHAKTICPKFCGLCSLVDGNWATWSHWSQCDVTCGNGTQTRTRTCTDPAPKNGGLDCNGTNSDTKTCLKDLCPIHGGWALWSNWETCSVSCGTGIARRHRNCSNPVPERFGDHCFGDTLDVTICSPGQCATPKIAFMAVDLVDRGPSAGQTMIFNTTRFNDGHSYSTFTGIFTSPVNGTFSFSAQFCVEASNALYIAIVVDGVNYATALVYYKDDSSCNTATAVALLHVNSNVWVKCTYTTGGDSIYQADAYRLNSFSGYLI